MIRRVGTVLLLLMAGALVAACASPFERPMDVPEDWVELAGAKIFVLYAPHGTRFEPHQGIVDSFVGAYRHPDFEIEFDYGIYNRSPNSVPSGLVDERLMLDGKDAVIFVERGSVYGYPVPGEQICVGLLTGDIEDPPPIRGDTPEETFDLPPLTLSLTACTDREETIETIKRVYKTVQFDERF